jgi:F-type H+-transporting ATPase subunit gamma
MANLKDIRRRIASVKGTQKITSAMKMVAAAKLRKAQAQSGSFLPYSALTDSILSEVAGSAGSDSHPLFARRPVKKILILVISSDRGLCGGFNSNLNKMVMEYITRSDTDFNSEQSVDISVIGNKVQQFFLHKQVKIVKFYDNILTGLNYQSAVTVASDLSSLFESGVYDRILLASNKMESIVLQIPGIVQLLPVEPPHKEEQKHEEKSEKACFIFEPAKDELLQTLVPLYVETKVFETLLESQVSEFAARMTAMETATNNAQDMIDGLSLVYNRARQTAITSDLMDIVGGAEALND